jgi:DNA-binding CsgD family transcriptional regulator
VLSDEILPLRELAMSELYADVLEPQGIAHNYMSPLIARPDLSVAFNMTRSVGEVLMHDDQRLLLHRLIPHLQRASQLHLRVEQYEALREASLRTLDLITMGVIIVDRWASVLFANQTAVRRVPKRGLARRDRTVSASPQPFGTQLRLLIQRAINGGSGGAMTLPDPAGHALPVSILVAPLRGRIVDEVGNGYLSGASAVLFIRDPNDSFEPDADVLAALFGLTPAEARVAAVLFKGEDFSLAAAQLGISINTLKTHARRIFGKVGVKRHSQFVRSLADRNLTIGSP